MVTISVAHLKKIDGDFVSDSLKKGPLRLMYRWNSNFYGLECVILSLIFLSVCLSLGPLVRQKSEITNNGHNF